MSETQQQSPERPRLEVGWVLDSRLEGLDRKAVLAASARMTELLSELFPRFDWRMPLARHELLQAQLEEPTTLLEAGSLEISRSKWDLSIVVTASDLKSHFVSSTVGVLARPLGVAVLSTFRIDPLARDHAVSEEERLTAMKDRLLVLAVYAIGRLCGLSRSAEPDNFMNPDRSGSRPQATFAPEQRERLQSELDRIGDERVEEEHGSRERGHLSFHLRAVWRNRVEILGHLLSNRSWEFPFRMGRLTTAAFAALALLMVTAESWEVGSQLSAPTNVLLTLGLVGATTAYIVLRQRLLALHRSFFPTEQIVVTRVSLVVFVLMGMCATYLLVFAVSLLLELAVFRPELVARWIGTRPELVGWKTYASQAGFTSALAILVGALGASFEHESYVRHIAYVDEEV